MYIFSKFRHLKLYLLEFSTLMEAFLFSNDKIYIDISTHIHFVYYINLIIIIIIILEYSLSLYVDTQYKLRFSALQIHDGR